MASARLKQFAALAPFFGVGMFVSFLIGIEVGRPNPSSPPAPVVVAPAPAITPAIVVETPLAPTLADDTLQHLQAAQTAVQTATHLLAKANTRDKGGYVEKARAGADTSTQDLAAAIAYAQTHPNDAATPVAPPAPPPMPQADRGKAPNVVAALDALNDALNDVRAIPGGLGGQRDIIIADLTQTAADSITAINFNPGRGPNQPVPPAPVTGVRGDLTPTPERFNPLRFAPAPTGAADQILASAKRLLAARVPDIAGATAADLLPPLGAHQPIATLVGKPET